VISGTPTTIQTVIPKFRVVDSSTPNPQAAEKSLSISINAVPQPTITAPAVLPNGIVGQAYALTQLTASGGTPPYTGWTVTPALPSGLVFNTSTGTISGTPTATSNQTHTFTVTDSFSPTPQDGSRQYTLTISPAPLLLTITTNSPLPGGTVTVAYPPVQLAATGGTAPLTWDLNPGSPALPAGLQLSQAGVLSGQPTTAVSVTPVFRVRDSATSPQQTATKPLSITTSLPAPPNITTTTNSLLPNGTFNQVYTRTLQVSGGVAPFVWSFTGGSPFPNWLNLNTSTGVISGTPNATGTFNFNVQVTDATGQSDPTPPALSITIVPQAPPNITLFTLPNGTVNQQYPTQQNPNIQLAATGGIAPYTWTVNPALPNGLSFSPSGLISGTPLAGSNGTTSHTFRVIDSTVPIGQFSELTRNLTINVALKIDTSSLPEGSVNQGYGPFQLNASGGVPPYSWTIVGGSPPAPGLSLSSGGLISGQPTTKGAFTNTYRVQDNNGAAVTQSLTITVAELIIDTTSLPMGRVGEQYGPEVLTASGGTPPYVWSAAVVPVLPAGLLFDPNSGTISGAPLVPQPSGSHMFTVHDAANRTATKTLGLTILDSLTSR